MHKAKLLFANTIYGKYTQFLGRKSNSAFPPPRPQVLDLSLIFYRNTFDLGTRQLFSNL